MHLEINLCFFSIFMICIFCIRVALHPVRSEKMCGLNVIYCMYWEDWSLTVTGVTLYLFIPVEVHKAKGVFFLLALKMSCSSALTHWTLCIFPPQSAESMVKKRKWQWKAPWSRSIQSWLTPSMSNIKLLFFLTAHIPAVSRAMRLERQWL